MLSLKTQAGLGPLSNLHYTKTMWFFLICYAATALVFSFQLGMTEQESYYWLWSKNLDWGYFDHPPLQAWVTAFLTFCLGDEKWVVRLPAFFGGVATFILFFKWVQSKWGEAAAQLAGLLLLSSNVFLFGSVIALPDSFAVPLGLAAMICAERGELKKTSVLLGFALLAKWTVLFIVPGIFYQLYQQKKLNRNGWLIMIGVPLVFHSPVIWWNIQHEAVSLKFHLYDRHVHEFQPLLVYLKNLGQFFLAQIFAIGITSSILLVILFSNISKKSIVHLKNFDWKSVLAWTLPGLFIVLISAVQGEIRFYWTFLSWLAAIAGIAYLVSVNYQKNLRFIKMVAIILVFVKWVLAGVAGFYPIGSTIEVALHLNPDLRHSPMGELSGWRQWIEKDLVPNHLLDKQVAFIGSDLHVAARMAWALRKYDIVKSIGVGGEKKNQFQFWAQPQSPQFTSAIFFGDNRYDKITGFEPLCDDKLIWNRRDVEIVGTKIKEIYWSRCLHLKPVNPSVQHFGSL